jgi:formylglycine-generating enzyme required for sulfatase activity
MIWIFQFAELVGAAVAGIVYLATSGQVFRDRFEHIRLLRLALGALALVMFGDFVQTHWPAIRELAGFKSPLSGDQEAKPKSPADEPPPKAQPTARSRADEYFAKRIAKPLTQSEERMLLPGHAFKECDDCPEMIVVPAGTFLMGSPPDEASRMSDEGPVHEVTFANQFAVGKYAVTVDEWRACSAAGDCAGDGVGAGPSQSGRRPAAGMRWYDAQSFAAWLSKIVGRPYRLLSEAEWEYMARAGTQTAYWWGNVRDQDRPESNALPSAAHDPNPWGLLQIHSLTYEWLEDCRVPQLSDSYVGAPLDGSAQTGASCKGRVERGGPHRVAFRGWWSPARGPTNFGTRVARNLSPPGREGESISP